MKLRDTGLAPSDLFSDKLKDSLFSYTQDEVDTLRSGLPARNQSTLFDQIRAIVHQRESKTVNKSKSLMDYIKSLTTDEVSEFEKYFTQYTHRDEERLWDILHTHDKSLYKTSESFYNWISTLSDEMLDYYANRALSGKPLHSSFVYTSKKTKVEILDGYIAISSSNLSELTKFKERMLANNNCECEHRIKKHGNITIHSYIFNMGKQNSI